MGLFASTFTFAMLFTKVSTSPALSLPHKKSLLGPTPQKSKRAPSQNDLFSEELLSSYEWGSIESMEGKGNDYMDESGEIGANSGYAKAMQRAKEKSKVSREWQFRRDNPKAARRKEIAARRKEIAARRKEIASSF